MTVTTRGARFAVVVFAAITSAACGGKAREPIDAGADTISDATTGLEDVATDARASTDGERPPGDASDGTAPVDSSDAMSGRDAFDETPGSTDAQKDATCDPARADVGRTTPDPDDPSCLLPTPQPLACVGGGVRTPVFECARSLDVVGVADDRARPIRADAQGIYFVVSSHLQWQPTGSPVGYVLEIANIGGESYAIDDDAVYFGSPADSGQVSLMRMKRDRSGALALAEIAPQSGLVLDRSAIYFRGVDGRIASVPKSGGAPVDTGLGNIDLGSFQADDMNFYWLAGSSGLHTMQGRAKGGGPVYRLDYDIGDVPWMRKVTDGIVVWVNNAFLKYPDGTGCPRVLAVPELAFGESIVAMEADDSALYWTTELAPSDSPAYYGLARAPAWGGAVASVASFSGLSLGTYPTSIAMSPSLVLVQSSGGLQKIARQ